jgi:hypothetical protein
LAGFSWSLISSGSSLLLRLYPTRDVTQGEGPRVTEPPDLEREKNVWKRGRRQAIDDAVMPMPASTVDHMDTSVLANKKSVVSLSWYK